MTVCQAPALLGCPGRRQVCAPPARSAVACLPPGGVAPCAGRCVVAGRRPAPRPAPPAGNRGGQGGHLGRRAGRRLGGVDDGVAGCPDRGQVRDIESGWACLLSVGCFGSQAGEPPERTAPGDLEPTRTGDQGQAEPPDGPARARKRFGYPRICEARGSSTTGSAPTGRAATKARPPRRRLQVRRSIAPLPRRA